MSDPIAVWNRALDYDVTLTAPGDIALRDALTFDGSAQNGGLTNAIEMYETDEEFPLDRVVEGFAFLGMSLTARLISESRPQVAEGVAGAADLEQIEETLDPLYPVAGEELEQALASALGATPEAFAPTS
ncbi:MAG: hypothetical protein Q4G51_02510 [Dermatophilus congolensis]|nr:hypothetical protein [Dermatophilus congolensis]